MSYFISGARSKRRQQKVRSWSESKLTQVGHEIYPLPGHWQRFDSANSVQAARTPTRNTSTPHSTRPEHPIQPVRVHKRSVVCSATAPSACIDRACASRGSEVKIDVSRTEELSSRLCSLALSWSVIKLVVLDCRYVCQLEGIA